MLLLLLLPLAILAPDSGRALSELVRTRRRLQGGLGREIRVAAGLSLAEVAAAVGVDPSSLAKWESGRRRPRPAAAARYAEVLQDLLTVVDLDEE